MARDWTEEYNGVPLWQHCFILREEGHGPKRIAELLNEDYELGLEARNVSSILHQRSLEWEAMQAEAESEEKVPATAVKRGRVPGPPYAYLHRTPALEVRVTGTDRAEFERLSRGIDALIHGRRG